MCTGDTEPGLWDPPFSNTDKILAGLWLARTTQTEPAFAPLSDNIREQAKKATWVRGMGIWSYYVKEKCLPIFLLEGQRCTTNTGFSTWQKGSSASLHSCLTSTEFSQDIQWFFYLGPNCSEAQLWLLVALDFVTSGYWNKSLRNCMHVLVWLRCTLCCCSCAVGMWIVSKGDWLPLSNAERFQLGTEESNDSTKSN